MSGGCGSCTLCCKLMGVKELDKPNDKWCDHCDKSSGCTIYETRPESCRIFECVWLQTQTPTHPGQTPLPPELQPNRCHVVLCQHPTDEKVIQARVDPVYPDAWKKGPIGRLIARLSEHGVSIIVACGDKRHAILTQDQAVKVINFVADPTGKPFRSDDGEITIEEHN